MFTKILLWKNSWTLFNNVLTTKCLTTVSLRYYKATKTQNRIIFKDAIKTSWSSTELLALTFFGDAINCAFLLSTELRVAVLNEARITRLFTAPGHLHLIKFCSALWVPKAIPVRHVKRNADDTRRGTIIILQLYACRTRNKVGLVSFFTSTKRFGRAEFFGIGLIADAVELHTYIVKDR